MPRNKAEEALRQLDSMSGVVTNEGQEMAESIVNSPDPRSSGGKAKFALPEAAATAVAASFILGPAGGLLLGAAQGLLGKKNQQNALDAQAANNEALAGFDAEVSGGFAERKKTARNEDDIQQLNGLDAQYKAARAMMASPYEEVQGQGAKLMEDVMAATREYDVRQETQKIAEDTAEQAAIAAMGKETWERHKFLIKEYDRVTLSHRDIRKQASTARTLLMEGEAMSDMTAVKLVERMVNSGTVLLSEAQTYREAGGFLDKVESFRRALRDGTFTDTMRVQLRGIIAQVEEDTHADQMKFRSDYLERAEDAQIEERYWDNYGVEPLAPVAVPQDRYGNPDLSQLSKPELRRVVRGQ